MSEKALKRYLALSRAIPLLARPIFLWRLWRGKEEPNRWREKLGIASVPRPKGRLIWLHAVGLGEVLALRGIITAMAAMAPDLSFLVTSSARSSAQVMAKNLPPRTVHQFLPLDAPRYLARFLAHWQPDLSVWSEQDFWPGAIAAAHVQGIPLALINARITAQSLEQRQKMHALYAAIFARFAFIAAQDIASASRLDELGAQNVRILPPLKPAAPPLEIDHAALAEMQNALKGRRVWLAASTHPSDENEAIAAAQALPEALLILAPRDIRRTKAIAATLPLPYAQRSTGALPEAHHRIYLADTYGEMGLWYHLAEAALIGGGFDAIGGHNPWEAALLDCAILHGPDTANFATDYALLDAEGAAIAVERGDLATALSDPEALAGAKERAHTLAQEAREALVPLAQSLHELLKCG